MGQHPLARAGGRVLGRGGGTGRRGVGRRRLLVLAFEVAQAAGNGQRSLMILVRGSPFGPMIAVRDDRPRLFHGAFGQVRGDGAAGGTGSWAPPVDLSETDDALVRQVELPGVSKDAVNVELHEPTLTLSGTRTREPAVTGGQSQREEGRYGAFQRAFRMPTIVDEATIQATY
ncbi:MAG: Hsp20/alpha crystallin family protein, partial [Candidatus Entotheonellia bacterium]